MTGIKDLAVGRSDTFLVNLEDVTVRPDWNCRDTTSAAYRDGILELAAQIKAAGQIKQALTGAMIDGVLALTDGHRRIAAMRFLAETDPNAEIDWRIPVRMEPPKSTEADRILSQILRNSGVPFTPLEQAAVVERLIGEAMSLADIAARMGYTETRIRQLRDMAAMPESVKAHVASGEIAATAAHNLVRKAKSAEEAVATIDEAVASAKATGRRAKPRDMRPKNEEHAARDAAAEAVRQFFGGDNAIITENFDGTREVNGRISVEALDAIIGYFKVSREETELV